MFCIRQSNKYVFEHSVISLHFFFVDQEIFVFSSTRLPSIFEFFIVLNFYFCNANETLSSELCTPDNLLTGRGDDKGASDNSLSANVV